MKKCTQCGQLLSDETNFCFKCGGANFEAAADSGTAYQQPAYQQPPASQPPYQQQPTQTPYYSQPSAGDTEPVSIGMNLLFLVLSYIPIVNIIYAIVVAATSKKKSYKNLAIAWFITLAVGIVLTITLWASIWGLVSNLVNSPDFNYTY